MPDVFDATGLTVMTATEITTALVTGLQGIYGADIQTEQNSPDGQFIGIVTQMAVDIRELLVSINNGFDPDQALGAILDQRVTLNNIKRYGGTYTLQPIDVTVSKTVTLAGLDANAGSPTGTGYTIQDENGNEFILLDTTTLTAGTTSLSFRAAQLGTINLPLNTITEFVTVINGVTSVNNSSAPTAVGAVQELDPQLHTRRKSSVGISSQGYLNGLEGALGQLTGVVDAVAYENYTDSVDANGIPAHGIWVIGEGGANTDIAQTIYKKKDPGANMKGSVDITVTKPDGSPFVVSFDRPTAVPLYIRFTIKTTTTGFVFNTTSIKAAMAASLSYEIGAFAETSSITDAATAGIVAQGGGGVAVLVQISNDNATWTDFLSAATLASQWTVATADITITVI